MIKTHWKRNVILYFSIFIILISMLSPALTTFADLAEAQQKFDKESTEFLKDAEEAKDIMRLLEEDAQKNPKPDRNTISFVMKRLLYPGVYVNDVRDGVVSSSIGKDKGDILHDGVHACNPNSPKNLIDHNCNIPNFTTGLIQNIANPFMSDFNNAGKTSSYSVFGLGVPENIPGGIVPISPESRAHSYTALELFGYSLPLTSYNGEWDQVVVSNEARMLSNFGVIDRMTLVGTGLWNSVKAGVGAFIENFSFNPVRWFGSIAKTFESAASSGINTVVDTSELNVVATNAWKRPRLDSSLYNIYVMTDAEVLRETARNYFTTFSAELNLKAGESAELKEVLALNPEIAFDGVTPFSYDPNWETEESIAAREKAEAKRAAEEKHNASEAFKAASEEEYFGGVYVPNYISPLTKIPEPVYYTESEQMGFWEKDPEVASVLKKALKNDLISGMASSYKTYDDMMSQWQKEYVPFFQVKFDAYGQTVEEILEDTDASVFMKYPHLDPKQSISRYACANPNGTIKRKPDGSVEYLYLKNNNGSKEYLNPDCSHPRPPIDGGLLGTGWASKDIKDTRHTSNVSGDTGLFHQLDNMGVSAIRGINSFIAKITNVILNLSFSPILEKLGVDIIVAKLVEGFRDTIFFPLVSLTMAVGAIMLFFQILRNGNAFQLLGSVAITLLIFVVGAAFLMHPSATINLIDKVPSQVDSIIANAVLIDDGDTSYCSTGDKSDGIRTAQCNVWGAMVFEPWVHLQFGTGSDNLYAKGHAPSGSGEFKNKNEKLVGDARVNMGGGRIEHNWAIYQLSQTKSGTINAKSDKDALGVVDKDLYRLVDLQAGPNGGAASDTRYFDSWSGKNNNGFIVFLTLIQSILMAIAIAGLGIAKIEVSFMFSISIIFLPIMLLYGLIPQGRNKMLGYISNLGSLLLKRVLITVMLAVLLKVITLSYSKSESLEISALIAIFVSVAFIMYRKELLELMTFNEHGKGMLGGNPSQLKETLADMTPKYVKQTYHVAREGLVGATAGFVGAAAGATERKIEVNRRIAGVRKDIKKLEKLQNQGLLDDEQKEELNYLKKEEENMETSIESRKGLSEEEYAQLAEESKAIQTQIIENEVRANELIEEDREANKDEITALAKKNEKLEAEKREISKKAAGGPRESNSILSEAFKGSAHSRHLVGRMAERQIRRDGFAALTAYKDVKDAVFAEGADKITNMEEEVEYDVYKEVMSHSKNNVSKSSGKNISANEQGQLKASPKVQKQIRELADKRRKMANKDEYSAITPDMEDIERAARIVDRRRGIEKVKLAVKSPIAAKDAHERDLRERNKDTHRTAKTDEVKKQLIDEVESRGGAIEYDNKGNFTVRDKYVIDREQSEQNQQLTMKEKELVKKAEEMRESKNEEMRKERMELEEKLNRKIESNKKEEDE